MIPLSADNGHVQQTRYIPPMLLHCSCQCRRPRHNIYSSTAQCVVFPGSNVWGWAYKRTVAWGYSGYPCLLYLTPIARPATDNERHYNRSHIMTRNILERLFGVLKHFLRRFACLHFGLRTKLSTRLIIIIVACCVLHNIARRHKEIHIRCWVGWWPLHWWWHHWS